MVIWVPPTRELSFMQKCQETLHICYGLLKRHFKCSMTFILLFECSILLHFYIRLRDLKLPSNIYYYWKRMLSSDRIDMLNILVAKKELSILNMM